MSPLVRSKKRPIWQRVPEKNVFTIVLPSISKAMFCHFYFSLMMRPILIFAYSYPYTYTDLQRYLYDLDQRDFTVANCFVELYNIGA